MDFNSLGTGNPFYILRRGEKPLLEVGVVKSKSQPRAQYPTQTPNIGVGLQIQQVVDVIATVNGKDETFPNLPINVEIAQKGNDTFSGSREAMLQAVDSMLQTSQKAIEQVDYHKSVLKEGEKMLEILNPRYAEEKKQARTIKTLEERQAATDAKLDSILSILQKLDSPN
jgi:hypothetical protein